MSLGVGNRDVRTYLKSSRPQEGQTGPSRGGSGCLYGFPQRQEERTEAGARQTHRLARPAQGHRGAKERAGKGSGPLCQETQQGR